MTGPVFELANEKETAALGARLASLLAAGDVLCLEGPLGAGKTTLARGLIGAYCGAGDVPSPTFTLVEAYEGGAAPLWHFDLYRLDKPSDVYELGLEEALDGGVAVIEWPDRIEDMLPDNAIRVFLEIAEGGCRRARLKGPARLTSGLQQSGIA